MLNIYRVENKRNGRHNVDYAYGTTKEDAINAMIEQFGDDIVIKKIVKVEMTDAEYERWFYRKYSNMDR